ncbi:hypothetical protein [Salinimicrobium gaetbulicola]|uniref:DUF4281 domain-containing protein n=1 Tax=Salinimicrobium gaetbulicola TaxID=999702 RepID=A0ABW3IG48_9FLAO
METIVTIISIILLLPLLSVPVLLFIGIKKWKRPKVNFPTYLMIGLIITAVISGTFAWWADYSDQLLMIHYGYDFDAMNDTDRFENVVLQNLERVKQLEIGYFGIGWPLQAIMTFVFYSPFLVIVYLVGHLITKAKRKNKEHAPNNG